MGWNREGRKRRISIFVQCWIERQRLGTGIWGVSASISSRPVWRMGGSSWKGKLLGCPCLGVCQKDEFKSQKRLSQCFHRRENVPENAALGCFPSAKEKGLLNLVVKCSINDLNQGANDLQQLLHLWVSVNSTRNLGESKREQIRKRVCIIL